MPDGGESGWLRVHFGLDEWALIKGVRMPANAACGLCLHLHKYL